MSFKQRNLYKKVLNACANWYYENDYFNYESLSLIDLEMATFEFINAGQDHSKIDPLEKKVIDAAIGVVNNAHNIKNSLIHLKNCVELLLKERKKK